MPDELPSLDEIRRKFDEWDKALDELPRDPKELRKLARKKVREMERKGLLPLRRCPHCGRRLR